MGNPSNDRGSYGPPVREPLLGVSWAYPNPLTTKKAAGNQGRFIVLSRRRIPPRHAGRWRGRVDSSLPKGDPSCPAGPMTISNLHIPAPELGEILEILIQPLYRLNKIVYLEL